MHSSFLFILVSLLFHSISGQDIGPGDGVVFIYYYSGWNPPYLYYNGGNGWIQQPGQVMIPSTNSSFPSSQWWQVGVAFNQLTWVFDDAHGLENFISFLLTLFRTLGSQHQCKIELLL